MVSVYVFDIGSIYIHGKEFLRHFTVHQKIQGTISRWNRCLAYLKSWQSDNQMRFIEWLQWTGKVLYGNTYLWSVMKKSSVSRTRRCTYFQILCYALKDEPEPRIKFCLGRKVDLVQEFITIQNLGHNWWWANEIRVEDFHQDSPHCSSATESKSSCLKWATHDHLHVHVQWHLMGIWRQWTGMRCSRHPRFHLCKEDLQQNVWSFLGPGSEIKWYSTNNERPGGKWDRVAELMMIKFGESGHPSFPSHESTVPRNA